MYVAFRYRLWTNANQNRELSIALETHRRLYNELLSYRQMAWDVSRSRIRYGDTARWFTHERKKNAYYGRLNASSAQATMWRLEKSFKRFFCGLADGAKVGYPRFKNRGRFNTIEFQKYGNGIKLSESRLYVQHVGQIRIKLHRPLRGVIKRAALKRESDKWYVVFFCELTTPKIAQSEKPEVGIDLGLANFLTTSDGGVEPNPRYFANSLPKLRRFSRAISRRKQGGSNRSKSINALRRLHARVKNLRREHHHQIACRLVLAYGLIAVESLNVIGMLKSRRISRAIADAGWSRFVSILKHKAAKAGVVVVEVDPRNTSQQCSGCGENIKKDLHVRWHACDKCGLSIDRDHNAALNILAKARLVRIAPVEVNVGRKIKRSPRSRRIDKTVKSHPNHPCLL